jgi:beta-1,4-mannosyltransferase
MLTAMPGRDQTAQGWVAETFAALSRVPVDRSPLVWAFTPFYTGNPFQAVLYSGFFGTGTIAAPAFRAADLAAATRGWPRDLPLVVHVHWLNQVLAACTDEASARQAAGDHTELLDLLVARGARLVWTVHNVLPHDIRFEAQEVALRQAVIDRAGLIHVMSPRTPELLAPWLTLPADRLYHCDHPGYQGVYPDWISRDDARQRLRVPDGSVALLLTGALKPYKGMTELLSAVQQVNEGQPGAITLIVAGRPDEATETQEFIAAAVHEPAVRLLPDKVPDVDFQVLMRAADIVALPYRRSLNSGVLALGLSFGRPALLPSTSGSVPLVADGASVIYDPDDPGALTGAVRACLELDLPAARAAAAAAGQRIHRQTVATRFAADLRQWADTGQIPGPASAAGPASSPAAAPSRDQAAAPSDDHAVLPGSREVTA